MMESMLAHNTEPEVLHQLLASATHEASAVMCRWTDGLITLSLDEVRELPLEEVTFEIGLGDDLLTMVVLNLEGEMGGAMILTFDEINGRILASALLRQPVNEGPWNELERSALTETGNILGCAYMNAITRLIHRELVPSPPYFIQDYGASVLQQAISSQAMTCSTTVVCRTEFHREGEALNWHVLFLPNYALRCAISGSLNHAMQAAGLPN